MNTFSLVQRALDASLADPDKSGLDPDTIETGRIVTAVQTVVDALTPPDGGRYIVAFADISTAQTRLGERRIIVSSKPLRDRSLSMVEKAVVVATFAAHEIGHTLVTRPRKSLVVEHNHHSGFHAVANLADDIILEPHMVDRFPILADAFEFTGLWVLRTTAKDPLPKVHQLTKDMPTPERFNILLGATRYGDIPEIVWADAATTAERDWCRAWADRLTACPLDDHGTFLALCDEAWLRIRSAADVEEPVITEPEPEVEDDEEQPEDDESESDESEPGEKSEPTDEEGEDEGEGGSGEDDEGVEEDEPGESPGGDEGDDDEGESDEGEPGESESESSTQPGNGDGDTDPGPVDWDDDKDGESEEGDGTVPDSGEQDTGDGDPNGPDGSGGDPNRGEEPRAEDDFDQNKVEESMHNQAERDPRDWAGLDMEERVRSYSSTTVTAFANHGSLSTTWS